VKIRILESARKDLVDGFYFYEKQAEGIGTYFLDSIYSDIESLIDNAGIHPVYFEEYYRLLAVRFPFAVYYKVLQDTVLVYAVLDCRREPAWTRTKLPPPTDTEDSP
jgi:hypothetical protein